MTNEQWQDEQDAQNIRVLRGSDAAEIVYEQRRADRSPQERHREDARDKAQTQAEDSLEALSESIGWAESVGIEIPRKVRSGVTILRQWITALQDEQR